MHGQSFQISMILIPQNQAQFDRFGWSYLVVIIFQALRFTKAIQDIGQTLVDRMRKQSGGRFIALHLR
jgi:hypothetical protein